MKKLIASLCLLASSAAYASGGQIHLDTWPEARGRDLAALQNGARTFVNYCMGCHSAKLMRWNRLNAIGLDDQQIREFLIFGNQNVGDPMTIAMRPEDANLWFGKVPPDTSVITRARTSLDFKGTDYLYTLLRAAAFPMTRRNSSPAYGRAERRPGLRRHGRCPSIREFSQAAVCCAQLPRAEGEI